MSPKTNWRPATEAELTALFELELRTNYEASPSHEDRDNLIGMMEQATIGATDHYISDCPGYAGTLLVVLWSGGPELYEVFGWDAMGQLYRIKGERERVTP